jgi:hypothetical protein
MQSNIYDCRKKGINKVETVTDTTIRRHITHKVTDAQIWRNALEMTEGIYE